MNKRYQRLNKIADLKKVPAFFACLSVLFFPVQGQESTEKNTPTTATAKTQNRVHKPQTLTIQSQVKGSQEQPNVIYIMPWQGVDKVIEVKGKKRTIDLPRFEPINPRTFKEQVRYFANKEVVSASSQN